MSFADKVVLVTGGSSGIGAAAAVLFAKEGAAVAVVGRNRAKLDSVAQRCRELGARTLLITADIANDQEASTIVQKTIDEFGKLDVLVNNAGMTHIASILADDIMKSYDTVIRTNLRATVHITSLAVPHLIKSKGNIVNISSTLARLINTTMLSYCISKAGLDHFSRVISQELGAFGVRVNVVSPGPVYTDILENAGLPDLYDEWGTETPLGKTAQPEEVADMILYLASDKAKSVTGANFLIDNGSLVKK
ncbi:uncharacterized protein LOC113503127 [Trichoplusia ni]|uniref:Uncharacterized protein LOC113502931 n=1 Tax=Trichoplusia ni TaxID=7111 RepID=A0A7E5WJJ7_TRINI|nr:uncharacterized protein LOC113502931 [Trichoplusia ni]XP_026740747.1 uncharacterized protein LOC113503127 [Trichoplusia ni]